MPQDCANAMPPFKRQLTKQLILISLLLSVISVRAQISETIQYNAKPLLDLGFVNITDINIHGAIIGRNINGRAQIYKDNHITELDSDYFTRLNNSGQAAGAWYGENTGGYQIYDKGVSTVFKVGPGFRFADINNSGKVLGWDWNIGGTGFKTHFGNPGALETIENFKGVAVNDIGDIAGSGRIIDYVWPEYQSGVINLQTGYRSAIDFGSCAIDSITNTRYVYSGCSLFVEETQWYNNAVQLAKLTGNSGYLGGSQEVVSETVTIPMGVWPSGYGYPIATNSLGDMVWGDNYLPKFDAAEYVPGSFDVIRFSDGSTTSIAELIQRTTPGNGKVYYGGVFAMSDSRAMVVYAGYYDRAEYYLLTPVPEPSSDVLFVIGATLLIGFRRLFNQHQGYTLAFAHPVQT